jgi:hypothetical protein
MKREGTESRSRKGVERKDKLEVKENYWSGYQRLRIQLFFQKNHIQHLLQGGERFRCMPSHGSHRTGRADLSTEL